MAGVAFEELAEGHSAVFGVVAGAVEGFLLEAFEQFMVLGADAAEGLEGSIGLAAGVVEVGSPLVLVVGDEGGIVFGDDLAEAVGADHLGVGKMSHNLPDAPFSGGGHEVLFFSEDSGQDDGQ